VPRASLVVIAATLSQFNLPEEGLLLIMGIDTFLDQFLRRAGCVRNRATHLLIMET
jgi:Na+/H+-dicarboxylate symporter